jgi:cellulose synthase/poly-beta-1,6-N-acetylglucosamine synthase-like glycosyltransferase
MGAEIIFIIAAILLTYPYVGYPALAFVLSRFLGRSVRRGQITPRISLIIAARNEQRDLAAKIENALTLDYLREKLEIIVASDCSTDRTDEIARSYASQGVILHRQAERRGKTWAQNEAVKISSGEILVFSDATTIYERDALRQIVQSFADPQVGCVAGQLIYVDRATSAVGRGCRSYWSYEKWLKQCESQLGSLIGVSGCLYAVRRSCHTWLARNLIDDFAVATEIHLRGLRTVYEPAAIAMEETNQRARDEFQMRVRVIEQTMSVLAHYRTVLDLRRHGMFAFQMLSHKVLRYAAPIWLVMLLIASWELKHASAFYQFVFFGQAVFYAAAMAGGLASRLGLKLRALALPYYFVLVNAASVKAFIRFMSSKAQVTWEPTREPATHYGSTVGYRN